MRAVSLDDGNLISTGWLERALAAAAVAGAPTQRVRAELSIEDLARDGMVSRDLYLELWERLVAASDRTLPLRAGTKVEMKPDDVLACVCATVPTLGAAIHTLAKYIGAWTHAVRVEVHVDDDGTTWVQTSRVRPTSRPGAAFADEFLLTDLVSAASWVTGLRFRPAGVRFPHARGAPMAAYRAALGVVPTFDAKAASFGFTDEQCRAPLTRHDPWIRSFAEESVARVVKERASQAPPGSFEEQLRRELVLSFGHSAPRLPSIAKRLGCSERTLRRRLEVERASFTELLDEARREEALRLLATDDTSIAEVASRLGFSHLSSFHRACVRWTGQSPSAVRRQRAAAG